ncbi:MAG TPA: DUF3761 domain-containing protein [Gemmatimonadales bacterium]|nr:DUF3761 domain-containing protein [Gemmatimonadales bacterium]
MRSTHQRIAVLLLLGVGGTALAAQAPTGATAKCKDGSYSTATSSRGRCSGHGGVAQLLNTTSTSTSSSATTTRTPTSTSTAAKGVPIGATFQCKDGSYSTAKTSTGACSRHGGVDHPMGGGGASSAAPAAGATASAPAGGAAPANATFQCKDGTYSTAKTSQGACSRHGGVDHALTAAPAAAPAAPAAAAGGAAASGKAPTVARPGDAPANATAKCRDGTYSASQQHSGSCSHHGGVAEWYQ